MKKLLCSFSFLLLCKLVAAQGCSDAGFCSLDVLKTHSPNKKASSANEVAAGINVGVGEQSTISLNQIGRAHV